MESPASPKQSKTARSLSPLLYFLGFFKTLTVLYVFISALDAGVREAVAVLHLRTHSSGLVPPGWELSGTGRQVPLEIHAGADGALGKALCNFPNSCVILEK